MSGIFDDEIKKSRADLDSSKLKILATGMTVLATLYEFYNRKKKSDACSVCGIRPSRGQKCLYEDHRICEKCSKAVAPRFLKYENIQINDAGRCCEEHYYLWIYICERKKALLADIDRNVRFFRYDQGDRKTPTSKFGVQIETPTFYTNKDEAILRLKEQAYKHGADTILEVRFEEGEPDLSQYPRLRTTYKAMGRI